MKREIKKANAFYTGGGIYIFHTEFTDGTFAMSDSEWFEDYTMIVDSDPDENFDDAYYEEWQQKHIIDELYREESRKFNIELLYWILSNVPKDGNYNKRDLERLLKGLKNNEF